MMKKAQFIYPFLSLKDISTYYWVGVLVPFSDSIRSKLEKKTLQKLLFVTAGNTKNDHGNHH